VGFHASPASDLEHWLRAQEDLLVMPLATLLVALDGPQIDDYYTYGRFVFDRLVRGDAELGLIPDVPDYTRTMMAALWRAAATGDMRAFATLGECYFAVLVPCGAFDGVEPGPDDAPPFSAVAMQITDESLPPLTFALRCWYEAAVRGDRDALLRFANISRTGPESAKRVALDLLTTLEDPSPREVYARGLVHAWLNQLAESVAAHTAAAERGDLDAAFELYVSYAQGLGGEADPALSRHWLERAAAGDHPRALYNVAAEYAIGTGRDKDPAKAAELYERSATQGNPRAAASLAYMILSDECPGSSDDAGRWLDVADAGGFDTATMLANAGLTDPRNED
jgi:TPR repeat protein